MLRPPHDDYIGQLLQEAADEWDAHPDQGQPMPIPKRVRRTRAGLPSQLRRKARRKSAAIQRAKGLTPTLYFK